MFFYFSYLSPHFSPFLTIFTHCQEIFSIFLLFFLFFFRILHNKSDLPYGWSHFKKNVQVYVKKSSI